MKVVTEPLRTHPKVDLDKWYSDFLSTGRGMTGSNRYSLPPDDDERTALLYQFLIAIVEKKYDSNMFCVYAYGSRRFQEGVSRFNAEIVRKFTRQVADGLREVEAKLRDGEEVDLSALAIFHHHHNTVQNYHGAVQNIEGGVHGGVAAQNSTVSGNVIIYNDKDTFAAAVRSLGDDLNDVLEEHREAVSEAFTLLIRAIEENTVPKTSQMAEAVEVIGERAPGIFKSLKTVVEGASGNVVAEMLKPLMLGVLSWLASGR